IFLRFTELLSPENTHSSLRDRKGTVRNRFIKINGNRATKTATLRTRAERIIKTKEARGRRPNIEVAMRAMPASGKRSLGLWISDCGKISSLRNCNDIDFSFAETQGGFDGFGQSSAIGFAYCDSVLNDLNSGPESVDFGLVI